jgi:hypothetical protein
MTRTFSGQSVERVERIEQILAEFGDAEEPLRQFALFDQSAGAPATAVDHLLVGEHGHVFRVPVHLGLLAVDEILLEEIDEQHLLAVIVVDVAGGEFARPVDRQAHQLELFAHRVDVVIGPLAGMDLVLHGRVLGGHAESVPAHRMQDVVAERALMTGDHVAHRVVARMADMDAPGRIGEHLEHVVFRPRVRIVGLEELRLRPGLLPLRFSFAGIVTFGCHAGGTLEFCAAACSLRRKIKSTVSCR